MRNENNNKKFNLASNPSKLLLWSSDPRSAILLSENLEKFITWLLSDTDVGRPQLLHVVLEHLRQPGLVGREQELGLRLPPPLKGAGRSNLGRSQALVEDLRPRLEVGPGFRHDDGVGEKTGGELGQLWGDQALQEEPAKLLVQVQALRVVKLQLGQGKGAGSKCA